MLEDTNQIHNYQLCTSNGTIQALFHDSEHVINDIKVPVCMEWKDAKLPKWIYSIDDNYKIKSNFDANSQYTVIKCSLHLKFLLSMS